MLSSRACARRRFEIPSKNVGVDSGNTAECRGGASLTRREGAIWGTLMGPKWDHPAPPVHHQQQTGDGQERQISNNLLYLLVVMGGLEPTTSAFARLWPHILNPSGGFCPHGIDKLLNLERAFGILEAQHIRPLKIGIGRMTHNGSVHVINEDVGISMKLLTARLFEILTHFLLACAFNKFAALSTNVTRCSFVVTTRAWCFRPQY